MIAAPVLYINEASWIGGAEGALIDLVSGLDHLRHPPAVVCPEEGDFPAALSLMGVPVSITPFYGLKSRNPLRYFETIRSLMRAASEHSAALIHVNHQYFSNYGIVLGKLARLPVLVHVRGVETDAFYSKFAYKIAQADTVVCVSEAVKLRLIDYALHYMPGERAAELAEKSLVTYDGFCPAKNHLSRLELREKYSLPIDAKVVGIVGQVTREKGMEDFLAAAEIVHNASSRARFMVVGQDPDRSRCYEKTMQAAVAARGLSDVFTFTGSLVNAAELLSGMDVSVLASHMDAFPRVVLESMDAGVPVVATRVGGVPEMISNELSGLLVRPRDPKALAEAILNVVRMPDGKRLHMTGEAKKSLDRFSIDSHVQQVQDIYSRMLSKKGFG